MSLRICIKRNSLSVKMFRSFSVILSSVSCLMIFVVISRMAFIEISSKSLHLTASSKDFSRSIKSETLLIVLVNCPIWLLLCHLSWMIFHEISVLKDDPYVTNKLKSLQQYAIEGSFFVTTNLFGYSFELNTFNFYSSQHKWK